MSWGASCRSAPADQDVQLFGYRGFGWASGYRLRFGSCQTHNEHVSCRDKHGAFHPPTNTCRSVVESHVPVSPLLYFSKIMASIGAPSARSAGGMIQSMMTAEPEIEPAAGIGPKILNSIRPFAGLAAAKNCGSLSKTATNSLERITTQICESFRAPVAVQSSVVSARIFVSAVSCPVRVRLTVPGRGAARS